MNKFILSELLACPKCKKPLLVKGSDLYCENILCISSKTSYPVINEKPVLVDFDNSVIQYDDLKESKGSSLVKRSINFSFIKKLLKKILNGSSKITTNNFDKLDLLISKISNPVILIVGGGTIGAGSERFIEKYRNSIISFDVYDSPNVDFIADGHSIPLINNSVDLVIIQAVIEHVINPVGVVEECYRVIKPDGYVYAETPFLQHVHEGAYDFTRYTVLGHRILFKNFETISMGFLSGVGQSLLWSLEYFVGGVFRSRKLGKAIKIVFFWIRLIEKFIPDNWNSDGACGSFFLGQKISQPLNKKLSDYLAQYDGKQK